jgi:hypothetical protein
MHGADLLILQKGGKMIRKKLSSKVALSLIAGVPLAALSFAQVATAVGLVELRADDGNTISSHVATSTDVITLNGHEYKRGPAYSPKKTCGVTGCHNYKKITKAYHFMQGALPVDTPRGEGSGVSDTWSSENQDGTTQKYLANAYGHLLSGGQYGAW